MTANTFENTSDASIAIDANRLVAVKLKTDISIIVASNLGLIYGLSRSTSLYKACAKELNAVIMRVEPSQSLKARNDFGQDECMGRSG